MFLIFCSILILAEMSNLLCQIISDGIFFFEFQFLSQFLSKEFSSHFILYPITHQFHFISLRILILILFLISFHISSLTYFNFYLILKLQQAKFKEILRNTFHSYFHCNIFPTNPLNRKLHFLHSKLIKMLIKFIQTHSLPAIPERGKIN